MAGSLEQLYQIVQDNYLDLVNLNPILSDMLDARTNNLTKKLNNNNEHDARVKTLVFLITLKYYLGN